MYNRWKRNHNIYKFDNNLTCVTLKNLLLVYSYETCVAVLRKATLYVLGWFSVTTSRHLNAFKRSLIGPIIRNVKDTDTADTIRDLLYKCDYKSVCDLLDECDLIY